MAWLPIVLGIITCWLFYRSDQIILLVVTLLLTLVSFWSWGIMHNFATEAAKKRSSYEGGFYDFTPQEAHAVPNWITRINLLSSIGILIVFIFAVFL